MNTEDKDDIEYVSPPSYLPEYSCWEEMIEDTMPESLKSILALLPPGSEEYEMLHASHVNKLDQIPKALRALLNKEQLEALQLAASKRESNLQRDNKKRHEDAEPKHIAIRNLNKELRAKKTPTKLIIAEVEEQFGIGRSQYYKIINE